MSTGLDKAIIEWWQNTAALESLVPPVRVSTEIRQTDEAEDDDDDDGHFDDCVVFTVTSDPHWRTNSQQAWKSSVKFSCLSIDYDRSKAIGQALAVAWNNTTFTGSASTITLARMTGFSATQDDGTGIWDHTVTFTMNHNGV